MPHDMRGRFPVYTRIFGNGPDRAVLLHCALAHSGIWKPVTARLSDRLTMIAPDMPGHGRSADWDRRADLHDQVTAIALDCIGVGGHVIGHSFGATVALRLALEAPEKVHSLTLIEPVLFAAARHSDEAVFLDYLARSRPFGEALQSEDWATAAADFIRIWGDGRPWAELSEKEQRLFAAQMPFIQDTEPCLVEDAIGLLSEGRLEGIACPTCLIRGERTEPVIRAIHATLAGRIPNAVDHQIDGAGHMLPVTHPDAVAHLIAGVLNAAAA